MFRLSLERYYSILAMAFVTLLLTANIISEKPLIIGYIVIPAGLVLFPITYLLGAVLAELYGFSRSRQIIWTAMLCNIFMACMCRLAIQLPGLDSWEFDNAYAQVLSRSSRLMVVSVFSYSIGELVNAYIIVRVKARMAGKRFWLRALCGSWVGEALETGIFVPLAFYQTIPLEELMKLMVFYYLFKLFYALCAMPFINALVVFLKKLSVEESRQNTSQLGTV